MTQVQLVAVDMDGTFLNDQMDYDRAHFAQLHEQMVTQHVQFVVASGNQYFQLCSFFQDYPDIIYVAENGAYIRDVKQEYAVNRFANGTVTKILQRLATLTNLHIIVCGVKSAYVLADEDPEWIKRMRQYYFRMELVPSFDDIDDQILKFALSCPPEQTDAYVNRLQQLLAGLAVPTSSGHGDIDIIQLGVHKAAGLQQLGAILGIDLSSMAAFGDGGNDLEMLRAVGNGVAMANAIPEVIAAANNQTTDNNAQGVLMYLDELLANNNR